MKPILYFVLLFSMELITLAQVASATDTKYLSVNGEPVLINGANYSPSKGWFQILDNRNTKAIEKDMDSLLSIGSLLFVLYPFGGYNYKD